MDISLVYNLRDALLCLSFLVGVGAGVMAIVRQYRITGILALVGFLLLGVDPIAEILIFSVFLNNYSGNNFEIFNWAYLCISTPAIILGIGCLIAALFTAIRPKPSADENAPMQVPEQDFTQLS